MTVSFGIEFEFDSLVKGRGYTSLGQNGAVFKNGFTYQQDVTAGTEMRTPVCVDVKTTGTQISQIFQETDSNIAPIMKGIGPEHTSLGQHIHIGQPGRMLDDSVKRKIAVHSKRIYPLLVALHANSKRGGYKSYRGHSSRFCYALTEHTAMSRDHYGEISNSHVGTVEFRKFDANIPQATLTCATILKVVAQGAINGKISTKPFPGFKYVEEMRKAIETGLSDLNVEGYLKFIFKKYAAEWKQLMETEGIPVCVWEVLNLTSKKVSIGDIAETHVYLNEVREFDYFTKMSKNSNYYFANLTQGLIDTLSSDNLVGVYEPIIPTEVPRVQRPRVPRTITPVIINDIEAEINACLTVGRMPPHIRYAYAARLFRSGSDSWQDSWQVQCELRRFVSNGPAEFETNFTRVLVRNPTRTVELINSEHHIWASLKVKLIAIFAPIQQQVTAPTTTMTVDNPLPLAVNRVGQLTPLQAAAASALSNMTIGEMRSSAARFYVAVENNVVLGVMEAHVNCSCRQGEARFVYTVDREEVRRILRDEVRRVMDDAGRSVRFME